MLHLPRQVVELALHRQQALRVGLRELLLSVRAAFRRDLQRLRPARQEVEETAQGEDSTLGSREYSRCLERE